MIEQMMRDVDPETVAAAVAAKLRFMAEVDALPETRRCMGAPVNHDGSCFRCGDDQGEYNRCAIRAIAKAGQSSPVASECICPKCGIRHGLAPSSGGF